MKDYIKYYEIIRNKSEWKKKKNCEAKIVLKPTKPTISKKMVTAWSISTTEPTFLDR